MTKFDPVAKGERGRGRETVTARERRARMETFRVTGTHPELAALDAASRADDARRRREKRQLAGVATRGKAYVDVAIDGALKGSIVIELLEDLAPNACARFARRLEREAGDEDGVAYGSSCAMTRVDDELRVVFGARGVSETSVVEVEGDLTHGEASVGVDRTSGEFSIATANCASLDASSQCVGRVVSGLEILRAITHRYRGVMAPRDVTVLACGVVRGACDVSTLVGVAAKARVEAATKARATAEARRNETQHDTLKRLRDESAAKGVEISDAVRSTIAAKKKPDAPPKKPKKSMLDSVLGSDSDESDK